MAKRSFTKTDRTGARDITERDTGSARVKGFSKAEIHKLKEIARKQGIENDRSALRQGAAESEHCFYQPRR